MRPGNAQDDAAATRAAKKPRAPKGYPGKRALDVVLSGSALLVLSPVLGLLWLLVKGTIGRPVIFRQKRPGFEQEIFEILKFRTMTDLTDARGNLLPDGLRLTNLGRFLRSTSLDELPELINVMRGEMSLVGPRPLLPRYLPYFRDSERARFDARPGVTGLAQVSGRNQIGWDERLALDVEYVSDVSFWLDMKILAMTFVQVIFRRGVAPDTDEAETWLDEERSGEAVTAKQERPPGES